MDELLQAVGMRKRKTASLISITVLMFTFLVLICTACSPKQAELKTPVDEAPSVQGTPKASSASNTIQLNFSAQDFSNRPLRLLSASQIGSIVRSTKIDDMITYVQYIPKEFNAENPEGFTYSYIEVSGIRYALSRSLGKDWYDLTKTTLAETDTVYETKEARGANYAATLFFVIKENIPTVIADIDGHAQMSDIDGNGTKAVISSVGTVPCTSIYFFDFVKQTVNIADINEQSGAKGSIYDRATNTFSLFFEPNQGPVTYVYQPHERLQIK